MFIQEEKNTLKHKLLYITVKSNANFFFFPASFSIIINCKIISQIIATIVCIISYKSFYIFFIPGQIFLKSFLSEEIIPCVIDICALLWGKTFF